MNNVDNRIIGLDLDGVIVDSAKSKMVFAKRKGYSLKREDTHADIIRDIMSVEDIDEMMRYVYQDPKGACCAELIDGAKDALARFKTEKIPYYLISRRRSPEIARRILKKLGIWPVYFNETNAFFVERPEDKDKTAAGLGVNIYMDDQPGVLDKLQSVPQKFLFDRFGHFQGMEGYARVANWEEFLKIVF